MNRWALLNPREKEIIWHYIVLGEKRFAVAQNMNISLSRIAQILCSAFRVVGVRDALELALLIGRNYGQVEMDAVALGFEMPKELTVTGNR